MQVSNSSPLDPNPLNPIQNSQVTPKICAEGTEGHDRLNKYCQQTGVDRKEVDKMLVKAEGLIQSLQRGDAPGGGPEEVKAVMWYAMAQACAYGEENISGAFRMEDPDGRVKAFLDRCLKDDAYPRISTHMKEAKQPQTGADFDKNSLPGNKSTLLYSKVPGNREHPIPYTLKWKNQDVPHFGKKGFEA